MDATHDPQHTRRILVEAAVAHVQDQGWFRWRTSGRAVQENGRHRQGNRRDARGLHARELHHVVRGPTAVRDHAARPGEVEQGTFDHAPRQEAGPTAPFQRSPKLQQGFGAVVIAFAIASYFQYDTLIVAWLTAFYPNGQIGL